MKILPYLAFFFNNEFSKKAKGYVKIDVFIFEH